MIVENERRLRLLIDSVPALLSYWDRELRNAVANDACTEVFGMTPMEAEGRHLRDGEVHGIYVQVTDITEHAEAERTRHDAMRSWCCPPHPRPGSILLSWRTASALHSRGATTPVRQRSR